MPRKNSTKPIPEEDDEFTPEQRRKLYAMLYTSDAQLKAGLSYGPYESNDLFEAVLKKRRGRRVTLQIPVILLDYLEKEAKRFGMTLRELIVTILETHRFADREEQLITLAIAESAGPFKTGRYQK